MVIKPWFRVVSFAATLFLLCPVVLFAQEGQPITGGLVEIENNRLYMIYAGKEAGLQTGDEARVMRDNADIAVLRLTSVLADSSVAEVIKLPEGNSIQETDLAVFSRAKVSVPSKTVPKEKETQAVIAEKPPAAAVLEETPPSVEVKEEKAPPQPPQETVQVSQEQSNSEQLRRIQEEWQNKLQGLNEQIAQMKSTREQEISGLNAELAEKEALIENLDKEKLKLSFSLDQSAKEISDLKKDMDGLKKEAGAAKPSPSKGERAAAEDPFERRVEKINQNLTTLQRQCQEEITLAREEARQGLFTEYDRWQKKSDETKTVYEGQIEKQRQYLKERQVEIDTLKNEKFGLAAELGDRDQQIISLKKEVDSLMGEMESIKGERSEKLRITQQSLEGKISEFVALENEYKEKIKALETGIQQQVSEADGKWQEKIKALQEEYEAKLNSQKSSYEEQLDIGQVNLKNNIKKLEEELKTVKSSRDAEVKSATASFEKEIAELNNQLSRSQDANNKEILGLKSRLKEKEDLAASLVKEKNELASNLTRNEADTAKFAENLKKLEGELRTVKTTRDAEIKSATASLEKETALLRQEKGEMTRTHEAKVASLENTLKEIMKKTDEQTAKLRAENTHLGSVIDGKEKELASVRAANAQMEKMKAPLEEKIEGLNKVLISLENTYKEKMAQALNEAEQKHAQDQAQAEAQFKGLQEAKDKDTAALKAELSSRDSQMAALTQEKRNLLTDLEHNAKQMERSRQQVEDLTRELETTRASRETQIQSAKDPLEKKIESLTSETASLKKTHEDELIRIRAESQETLTARIQEKEAQLQEQKRSADEQIASLQKDTQEKTAQFSAQMRDMEKNKDNYIATLIAELKDKQIAINTLSADKTTLETDLSRATQDLAGLKEEIFSVKKELEASRSSQAEAVRMAKLPLEERIEGLNSELISSTRMYEDKIASQDRQLRQEILLKETDGKTKLDETIAAYEAKLAQQGKSWEDQLNNNQAKLYEEIARLKTQYDDLKTQTDRKVLMMVAELDEKQSLIKNLEKGKADLAAKVDQNNKDLLKLNQELGSLTEELKNTKNTQAERMQAVKAPLEEEIKKLTGNLNALKKDHQMQLAAANESAHKELSLKDQEWQSLNKLKDGQAASLETSVKDKENQIGVLRKEKNDLAFDLEQTKTQLGKIREELAASRASAGESIRLAQDPLEKKISSLSAEMASLKQDYEYKISRASEDSRRQIVENDRQWEVRLAKLTEQYENELGAQRQKLYSEFVDQQAKLQEEIAGLTDELMRLRDAKESELFTMQVDYEDRLAALKEQSSSVAAQPRREASGAGGGERVPSPGYPAGQNVVTAQASALQGENTAGSDDYYTMIRQTILNNFRKFNFLDYQDKEDYVKIEFELFSNGSLKEQPQFFGARDEKLKELLYQHFMEALPFPPFPENIKKKSQRFTIIISFKTDAT